MRLFQDPTTGSYIREDGKPGYACARCGNGYASAATRDDIDAHGCIGLDEDMETFQNSKGVFDDGYTPDDINALGADLRTVEFACLWEYRDDLGFGGHSEIIGRTINADGTHGAWQALNDTFWLYLHDAQGPTGYDDVEFFLDGANYHVQDLTVLPVRDGANVAVERR